MVVVIDIGLGLTFQSCSISGRINAWTKNATMHCYLERPLRIHNGEKPSLLTTLLIGSSSAQAKVQQSGAAKKLRVFLLDCVAITVAHSSIAISPLR